MSSTLTRAAKVIHNPLRYNSSAGILINSTNKYRGRDVHKIDLRNLTLYPELLDLPQVQNAVDRVGSIAWLSLPHAINMEPHQFRDTGRGSGYESSAQSDKTLLKLMGTFCATAGGVTFLKKGIAEETKALKTEIKILREAVETLQKRSQIQESSQSSSDGPLPTLAVSL